MTKTKAVIYMARMFSERQTIQLSITITTGLIMRLANSARFIKRLGKQHALALSIGLLLAGNAVAENCGRVNAYWNTNMVSLLENISGCDSSAWQKCSQAAAIHYDLIAGSLGQRASTCGLQTPAVPGQDYTEPQATDTRSCLSARNDLRDIFETRALARLACAAAREGGDDQEWLDSQCSIYRSQMSNYHLSFRSVAQHCELDYEQLVATLDK